MDDHAIAAALAPEEEPSPQPSPKGRGSGAATQPSTQPGDLRAEMLRRIDELILDLDGPDPAAREAATIELIAIGPPALVPLKKMLEQPASPEFKSRAERILAEIPKKWHLVSSDGGEVVGHFQAVLHASREAFDAGQPIVLNVDLRNVGPNSQDIFDIRAIDLELPDAKAAFTSPGAEARLVIRAVPALKPPAGAAALVFNKAPRQPLPLGAGGACNTLIQVQNALRLPPGQYEAEFIYYARTQSLVKGAWQDIRSNTVRFAVR